MTPADGTETAPGALTRYLEVIGRAVATPIIYHNTHISSYCRKRLIALNIPFVIPGEQMYLPMLMMDLREHFKPAVKLRARLTPAAQVVLVRALLGGTRSFCTKDLVPWSGYSAMTVSKAFRELSSLGLADITKAGREVSLEFRSQRRELWELAKPYLRTPVGQTIWVSPDDCPADRLSAGRSALAGRSMLADSDSKAVAVSLEEWKTLRDQHPVEQIPADEPSACEIQIWLYDPHLFAENHAVDTLSLFLSLQDMADERVQIALEEMMEAYAW
jgi:hypothetical protein